MLVVLVFSTMLYSNLHCVSFTFFFLFFSMEVSSLFILPSFFLLPLSFPHLLFLLALLPAYHLPL